MTTGELMTMQAPAGALVWTVNETPLDRNPAAVYLAGLHSAKSRATMQEALGKVAALLAGETPADWRDRKSKALRPEAEHNRCFTIPWGDLQPQHARLLQTILAEHYAPASANKLRAALRGTLKAAQDLARQAYREAMLAADPTQRADLATRGALVQEGLADTIAELQDAKLERDEDDLPGRALTPGELRALLGACADDPTPAGIRDGALIAVAYACGPRRSELAGLDLADFDPGSEGEGWLTIEKGKGNKTRRIAVTNGAREALLDWLSVRGDDPGPLFVSINRGGRLGDKLTAQAVYNVLAKRGAQAKIPGFSPHDLRRTFISDLLDAGADITTVAKLAGHANVATTARYDRRGDRAKRKAVDLLSIPYTRRRLAIP